MMGGIFIFIDYYHSPQDYPYNNAPAGAVGATMRSVALLQSRLLWASLSVAVFGLRRT